MSMVSVVLAASLLVAAPPARASAFGPGEQTVLTVEYLGITSGSATITVGNASKQGLRDVWPIVTVADTSVLFALFPLHDKFVTWWDIEAGRSIGWDFYANENRKSRRERVRLNVPEPGKAQVQSAVEGQPAAVSTVDVDPTAQDIAASFFALRAAPLTPGKDVVLPVFTGKHSWNLVAHVGTPQPLEVAAGKFEALPVEAEVHFLGKLESKRSIKLMLSNDVHHALLQLDAELAVGSVHAEATAYHPGTDPRPSAQ